MKYSTDNADDAFDPSNELLGFGFLALALILLISLMLAIIFQIQ